ncbi:MAG: hypothetical protein J6F30_17180 [Cellulosilyticum sp.]|nr:hypothetical protein [Cellulosilyticum sp.]
MTYRDLLYKATRLCDKGEITLGEYEEMTKPLDREVEQEPILDKIRAEIEKLRPNLRPEQMTDYDYAMVDVVNDIVAIIDKYKAESEET